MTIATVGYDCLRLDTIGGRMSSPVYLGWELVP